MMKRLGINSATLGLMLVAVALLNILAALVYVRFDATGDDVFTLSEGSRKLLEKVSKGEDDIEVKFYFSKSLRAVPVPFKTHAVRVEELLSEYAQRSGGRIRLESYDPRPDTEEEEWARKYGVAGLQLPGGEQLYFGAVFLRGKKEIAVPYFDPRKEEFLEYEISQALARVLRRTDAKVGVMSALPLMGNPFGGEPPWAFVSELQRNFEVVPVQPTANTIDANLGVLLVVHPKSLPDSALYAIDQFVLRGGQVVAFVDPMSRTELGAAMQTRAAFEQGFQPTSDLGKLFQAWEIEYSSMTIVGDGKLATSVGIPGMGSNVLYPPFLSLQGDSFSQDSVITKDLKQMLYAEGGWIEKKKDGRFTFEPLLQSSSSSGSLFAMGGQMDPSAFIRQFKSDEKVRTLAALVRGKFRSAFAEGAPKDANAGQPHLAEAAEERNVLVVADVDLLADANSVRRFEFAGRVMSNPINDNVNFVVNAVELLAGGGELASIRSRGRLARPFTRLQDIESAAQQKWKSEEEGLSNNLRELQAKLSKLEGARIEGNRVVLSEAQSGEIQRFREEEVNVRKRLREVRKNLREDIERLGRKLIALNMLGVPSLVAGFGLFVFVRRARRARGRA